MKGLGAIGRKVCTMPDKKLPMENVIAADRTRCAWAEVSPSERQYHDEEWGVPLRDDRRLFELLCLEGAQAGLSWRTVLEKRAHYQQVYHQFDIAAVAAMTDDELEALLEDKGIIRNRLKVFGFRKNAQAAQKTIQQHGSLAQYMWQFVDGQPVVNHWQTEADVPVQTERSDAMSRQLKKDGFTFVGSTICYAFMQASGMVNDHVVGCWRHPDNLL